MKQILSDFSPLVIIVLITAIGWALAMMIGASTVGEKYVCPKCRSTMEIVRP